MKFLGISLFIFSFILVKLFTQNPLPYSKYNTAKALFNYLEYKTYYYTPDSLFFQFDSFYNETEITNILTKTLDLYNIYGVYSVFLILDANANITDIDIYIGEVSRYLEVKTGFQKDKIYTIVMQYNISNEKDSWNFKIKSDRYSGHFLPESEIKILVDNWGPKLKNYNYDNIQGLVSDIFIVMDKHENDPWDDDLSLLSNIIFVSVIFILLFLGGGGIYYYKKRSKLKSYNIEDEDNEKFIMGK